MAACLLKPALHRDGQKVDIPETRQAGPAGNLVEFGAGGRGLSSWISEEEFSVPFRSQNNPDLLLTSQHRGCYSPIKPTRCSFRKLCILVGESGVR